MSNSLIDTCKCSCTCHLMITNVLDAIGRLSNISKQMHWKIAIIMFFNTVEEKVKLELLPIQTCMISYNLFVPK